MPLLLVSDTHMHFGALERMIAAEQPSAVLHAGDLGLYDSGSWDRISAKERKLIVKHRNPMQEAVDWTEGRFPLSAPLVAIPGNHEDYAVVEAVEGGRHRVPGLTLLVPGQWIHVCLGDREITVMGLGRVLLGGHDPSPRLAAAQITAAHCAALESARTGERPDVLLLHEPPRLERRRGVFGSTVISGIIDLLEPRLVVVGHMHFPYQLQWGPSLVVGLGYGVVGHYAVLDDAFQVHHRDLMGRPVAFQEVVRT